MEQAREEITACGPKLTSLSPESGNDVALTSAPMTVKVPARKLQLHLVLNACGRPLQVTAVGNGRNAMNINCRVFKSKNF